MKKKKTNYLCIWSGYGRSHLIVVSRKQGLKGSWLVPIIWHCHTLLLDEIAGSLLRTKWRWKVHPFWLKLLFSEKILDQKADMLNTSRVGICSDVQPRSWGRDNAYLGQPWTRQTSIYFCSWFGASFLGCWREVNTVFQSANWTWMNGESGITPYSVRLFRLIFPKTQMKGVRFASNVQIGKEHFER